MASAFIIQPSLSTASAQTALETPPARFAVGRSLRIRPEGRANLRFEPAIDLGYVLTRLRVHFDATLARWLTARVESQDSRSPGLRPSTPSVRDPLDLHQGYLEVGAADGPVRLRVGRQELVYGSERLFSRNDWRNTGRVFDAARVFVSTPRWGLDLFGAAEVKVDVDRLNPIHQDREVVGGYGRWDSAGGLHLESYAVWR